MYKAGTLGREYLNFQLFLNDCLSRLKRFSRNPISSDITNVSEVLENIEEYTIRMKAIVDKDYECFQKIILEQKYNKVKPINMHKDYSQYEKRIQECILDKLTERYPKNVKKRIQRELIDVLWAFQLFTILIDKPDKLISQYYKLCAYFLNLNIDIDGYDVFFKKYNEINSLIKTIDKTYHLLIESLLLYGTLSRNILSELKYDYVPWIKGWGPRTPFVDLDSAWNNFYEGNFGIVLAEARLALEFAFYHKLQFVKRAIKRNLGWKKIPYFKEVITGCKKSGILLPASEHNIKNIYTYCGRFIHTGYRGETHHVWKVLSYIDYIVRTLMKMEINEKNLDNLVTYLNEN